VAVDVLTEEEAARLIRAGQRFSKSTIVAMTAHAMASHHNKSLVAGMNHHLTKQINPNTLKEALVKSMPGALYRVPDQTSRQLGPCRMMTTYLRSYHLSTYKLC
jgi:CheY-like chemotaxis protein